MIKTLARLYHEAEAFNDFSLPFDMNIASGIKAMPDFPNPLSGTVGLYDPRALMAFVSDVSLKGEKG